MYDVDAILETPALLEPLRESIERDTPPPFLRSVKIKLTPRCNLTCVMCRYGKGLRLEELDSETWCRALDEMADLGCRKVHFSGGEVLIRKDFEDLVHRSATSGMKVTLTSNLTLLTKERAKALMRVKISSISTSLDGATSKMHESIRGIEGSFKRTLMGLDHLVTQRERRGRRTRLRVNFVMMRRNFTHYPGILRLAGERGATDVIPMPVDSRRTELRLSKRLIRFYNHEIAPEVYTLRAKYGFPLHSQMIYPFGTGSDAIRDASQGQYASTYYQRHACYAPYLHMFVAWDGCVYLCCMTNGRMKPLGNITHASVKDIFGGPRFQAVRATMMQARRPECHACDMYLHENRALATALPQPEAPAPIRLPLYGA